MTMGMGGFLQYCVAEAAWSSSFEAAQEPIYWQVGAESQRRFFMAAPTPAGSLGKQKRQVLLLKYANTKSVQSLKTI